MVVGIYKQSAKDIMTAHVVTLRPQDTIHFALLIMAEKGLTAIPVVDSNGKCVGMISQRDVITLVRENDARDQQHADSVPLRHLTDSLVTEVMSAKLVSIGPTDAVPEIAGRLLASGIHHLPVLNEAGELLGIVSTMDILDGLRSSSQA